MNVLPLKHVSLKQVTERMNPGEGPVSLITNERGSILKWASLRCPSAPMTTCMTVQCRDSALRDHEDIRLGWRVRLSARCWASPEAGTI